MAGLKMQAVNIEALASEPFSFSSFNQPVRELSFWVLLYCHGDFADLHHTNKHTADKKKGHTALGYRRPQPLQPGFNDV